MDFSKVVGSYKSVEKCFKAWGQKRADRAADRKLASASSELTDPPELVILSKAERGRPKADRAKRLFHFLTQVKIDGTKNFAIGNVDLG